MKSISGLSGLKVLSKKEQKMIVGATLVCTRSNGKEVEYFYPIGAASAVAWVSAWDSLGWNASCVGER